ncbi:hypothetical protein Bca52824_033566 [Brassica carinata]|uniref:AN1-type domain-containing protein n=1 Tax=Brassica carinata TaxID=52824 RepID=A0A8X7SGB4_BRACI|nr:hypothetical protein Bca52824_033566 [Brassica carinata]
MVARRLFNLQRWTTTRQDAKAHPKVPSCASTTAVVALEEVAAKPKEGPSRCTTCNKRVGLTRFKCHCGDLFCGTHRYADVHNCSFDNHAAGYPYVSFVLYVSGLRIWCEKKSVLDLLPLSSYSVFEIFNHCKGSIKVLVIEMNDDKTGCLSHPKVPSYASTTAVSSEALPQRTHVPSATRLSCFNRNRGLKLASAVFGSPRNIIKETFTEMCRAHGCLCSAILCTSCCKK